MPPAIPEGPFVRVRLTIAYDGAAFHGFAAQPGQRTVGGTLAEAIEAVVGHPVKLTCAGRTDTGVHAWGQVAHFDLMKAGGRRRRSALDVKALADSCNRMLAPSIVVREAEVADPSFDARHSALARCYRYTVLSSPVPHPFLAATAWHVTDPLDTRAMRLAADPLIGEHDFSAFCRRPPGRKGGPLVRRVRDARWSAAAGGLLVFEIEAESFCHQMVRSVVGTMVDVGRGRRRAGEMAGILAAGDRAKAGSPAPPHGLCLWSVTYREGDRVARTSDVPVSW